MQQSGKKQENMAFTAAVVTQSTTTDASNAK